MVASGQLVEEVAEAVAGHSGVVQHHQSGEDAADEQPGQHRPGRTPGPCGSLQAGAGRGRAVEGAQPALHPALPAPLLAAFASVGLHPQIVACGS